MQSRKYFALDTETSHSGTHEVAEVLQVAIVEVGDCIDAPHVVMNQLYKPCWPIQESATKVHGLTASKLRSQPEFEKAHASQIMAVLNGCAGVIGHNIAFDIDRLRD